MDNMIITQTVTMARWQIVVRKSEATNIVLLAVADGLFGLCGSQRSDEVGSCPFPVPNK